jgi:hypothetical protein
VPTTPNRSLRYPAPSNSPNIPQDIQNLATDVDNSMALIFGKMWRTAGGGSALTVATEYVIGMDVARTNGGVTFDNTNDQLTVPVDGLYTIDCCLYITNPVGNQTGQVGGWVRRTRASVADLATCQGELVYKSITTRDQRGFWSYRMVPLKAGDKLAMIAYAYDASLTYYGGTEYNGSFLSVTYEAPLGGATPI